MEDGRLGGSIGDVVELVEFLQPAGEEIGDVGATAAPAAGSCVAPNHTGQAGSPLNCGNYSMGTASHL